MTAPHSLQASMPPPDLEGGLHRKEDGPAARWPVVAVALLGVLAVVIGIFVTSGAGDVEDQRDAAVQEKIDLGREVVAACARGEVVQSPTGQDLCRRGIEVQSAPVPVAQGLPGEQGRPPTAEEIRAAVNAYMLENPPAAGEPGRAPTTEEVAAAVAQYLTANPPQPGRPPTAAEIASAVATYFATNPPPQGDPGRDGRDGERGRPPTAEEIQTAVNAWLTANPPPMGPRGPAGPTCQEGTHLETVVFADEQSGLACVFDDQPEDPDPTTEPTTTPTIEPDDGGILGG